MLSKTGKIWTDAVNSYRASVNLTLEANAKRAEEQNNAMKMNAHWVLFCNGDNGCLKKHGLAE